VIPIIIWLVVLIVGVVVTIYTVKNEYGFEVGEYIGALVIIWVGGLFLAMVAGIVGAVADAGNGWNWFFLAFIIAPICSIIMAVFCGIADEWDFYKNSAVYGGTIGLSLIIAFIFSFVIYEGAVEQGRVRYSFIYHFINNNMSVQTVLIIMAAFPIVGVIIGLLGTKRVHTKKVQAMVQISLQQQEERHLAEERRIKEQEERAHEQFKNNVDRQIDDMFKN
jgi:hypothetical protein